MIPSRTATPPPTPRIPAPVVLVIPFLLPAKNQTKVCVHPALSGTVVVIVVCVAGLELRGGEGHCVGVFVFAVVVVVETDVVVVAVVGGVFVVVMVVVGGVAVVMMVAVEVEVVAVEEVWDVDVVVEWDERSCDAQLRGAERAQFRAGDAQAAGGRGGDVDVDVDWVGCG
jgi:hypothetical protein